MTTDEKTAEAERLEAYASQMRREHVEETSAELLRLALELTAPSPPTPWAALAVYASTGWVLVAAIALWFA